MKATAGKVMVVSAMVLVLGLAAASSAGAASKSNTTTSTNGAIWTSNTSSHQSAPAKVNQGHGQIEQSREQGCFAGTASANARCIARSLANKVVNLLDTAIWGGGGFGPPPR